MKSVMECERSVITMTLLWHDYLVSGLSNCVDDTLIETGLTVLAQIYQPRGGPTVSASGAGVP